MRTPSYLILGAVFAAAACVALAGPLPPPPAGYKVVQNPIADSLKAAGTADDVEACNACRICARSSSIFCSRVVADEDEDLGDVFQEVFAALVRGLPRLRKARRR